MALIFGKYFWIWIVAWCGGVGYFGLEIVKHTLQLFRPAQEIRARKSLFEKHEVPPLPKLRMSVVTESKNIFDPKNNPVQSPPQAAPPKDEKEPAKENQDLKVPGCPPLKTADDLPETKLKIVLQGTSVNDKSPQRNMAAIFAMQRVSPPKFIPEDSPTATKKPPLPKEVQRVEMYSAGEIVMGARICKIERKRIILFEQGKFHVLLLESQKPRPKSLVYGSLGLSDEKEEKPFETISTSDVPRSTIQHWLANPMQYAMQARVMPHKEDGRAAGMRMVWVQPGSLYEKLGVKSGDIIQQINGKDLSIGNALGLYSQLPYANELRINFVRNGARQSMVLNVK